MTCFYNVWRHFLPDCCLLFLNGLGFLIRMLLRKVFAQSQGRAGPKEKKYVGLYHTKKRLVFVVITGIPFLQISLEKYQQNSSKLVDLYFW